jgi:hypothetical protein
MKMKMQMIQLESIVNLIPMKLMKVIDKMRNGMSQECQYCVEFQGIEGMNLKMYLNQLESIADLVQTTMTEFCCILLKNSLLKRELTRESTPE